MRRDPPSLAKVDRKRLLGDSRSAALCSDGVPKPHSRVERLNRGLLCFSSKHRAVSVDSYQQPLGQGTLLIAA
jgi:hypothetical protein